MAGSASARANFRRLGNLYATNLRSYAPHIRVTTNIRKLHSYGALNERACAIERKCLAVSCQQDIRLLHTSSSFLKTKGKKGGKMEVIVNPRDAEEFIDLNRVMADMHEAVEDLKHDYVHNFRIGADIKLLDQLKISLEGDEFQLREVANIKKKSEKALELDFVGFPEALPAAQSAIESSNLNLNPSVKGTKMEVLIPAITAERRKTLAKAAKQKLNETKERIKKIRNGHEKQLKKIENIPEDTDKAIRKQIGIYVDATSKEAENVFKVKEKDLLLQ